MTKTLSLFPPIGYQDTFIFEKLRSTIKQILRESVVVVVRYLYTLLRIAALYRHRYHHCRCHQRHDGTWSSKYWSSSCKNCRVFFLWQKGTFWHQYGIAIMMVETIATVVALVHPMSRPSPLPYRGSTTVVSMHPPLKGNREEWFHSSVISIFMCRSSHSVLWY